MAKEGYATGAFVSHRQLDSQTGLNRGFELFDDRFNAFGRGSDRIQLFNLLQRYWDWLPNRRSGQTTITMASRWMEGQSDKPAFLWVHLDDLMPPYDVNGETLDLSVGASTAHVEDVKLKYNAKLEEWIRFSVLS